jgi:hypothetical protein
VGNEITVFDKIQANIDALRETVERLKEKEGDDGLKEHLLKQLKEFELDVFDLEE